MPSTVRAIKTSMSVSPRSEEVAGLRPSRGLSTALTT